MDTPESGRYKQLFLGTFIHSKKFGELEYLHDTAICVDESGKIVAIEPGCGDQAGAEQRIYPRLGWSTTDAVTVTSSRGPGQFFFPGFIDTHLHAPQYPNVGIFGKSTLLDWLNTYTFPMEASMADLGRAAAVYGRCVRKTLSHGTTTAAYFATIHVAATNLLADLCLALGQRAFVGRVCMDQLGPDYYLDETADAGLAATCETIAHVRSIDPGFDLVSPILTPRFAPACTADMMAALGALQKETGLPVQTHIAENTGEVALVASLFPESKSYTDVYDTAGLLTDRTVLAHAIHLSEAEADLIASRGSGVAHCPCSNSAITSGEARVRWLLEKGINVGLGTDMSGGYSPSVLEAARLASLVSNHLAMPGREKSVAAAREETGAERRQEGGGLIEKKNGAEPQQKGDEPQQRERAKLSVDEVLHLATRGGAEVVGLKDRVGGFEVGMEFDAQLIGLAVVPATTTPEAATTAIQQQQKQSVGDAVDAADEGNVDVFGWETWEDRVAKWVYNGDDRNTRKVWVKGRLVHERRAARG